MDVRLELGTVHAESWPEVSGPSCRRCGRQAHDTRKGGPRGGREQREEPGSDRDGGLIQLRQLLGVAAAMG